MSDLKIHIRRATQADLPFLVAAGKKETETIGFLPTAALREYISKRNVLIAVGATPASPVGFLLWRLSHGRRQAHPSLPTGRHVKIIQLCVLPRFRRQNIGTRLVQQLAQIASRRRAEFLSAWVAEDIDAVAFWERLGMDSPWARIGGSRRQRFHLFFCAPLSEGRGLDLNLDKATEAVTP